ncbi:aspartyl-phosphate phosphatase Spo0E family protein [Paenibacillus sp. GCM10012306]|uniref:aspartyl-phosphate phosphatase Spo0E family protein n=1 Tax=Paenibacillus sp. GCM10012306 TaxID=3317342 RepID=UPI003612D29C
MHFNHPAILHEVEKARENLYQTQQRYGFLTHPKVIEQSMILDELLNQYQRKLMVN